MISSLPGPPPTCVYLVCLAVIRMSAGPVCADDDQALMPNAASPAATSRTTVLYIPHSPFAILRCPNTWRPHRQLHGKSRPLTDRALEVDRASVCLDHSARERKPEPAAGDTARGRSATEKLGEHPVVRLGRNSEALVAHANPHEPIVLLPRNLDRPPSGRVLDRVRDEIREDLCQPAGVPLDEERVVRQV